jgi:hypothetical protein
MRTYKRPMFAKRHYEAVADTLKDMTGNTAAVMRLAQMFSRDNYNFKPEKFFEAALPRE